MIRNAALACVLALLCLATSVHIVVDAGEWYAGMYDDLNVLGVKAPAALRGIALALFLEMFYAVMLAVRVPVRRLHPVSILRTVLAVVLFGVIWFGTAAGINENLGISTVLTREERLEVDSLRGQIEASRDTSEDLADMGQPGNYALEGRHRREAEERIAEIMSSARERGGTAYGSAQIGFLWTAKLVLIASNGVGFWMVGFFFRRAGQPQQAVGGTQTEGKGKQAESKPLLVRGLPQTWTRNDFLRAMKRSGMSGAALMEATGLSRDELLTVVNNTGRVIRVLDDRRRASKGDSNGQEEAQGGQAVQQPQRQESHQRGEQA